MPDGDSGLIYVPASSSAAGGYLWSFANLTDTSDLTTNIAGTQSVDAMFFTAALPA
jgi:hypothetical protein